MCGLIGLSGSDEKSLIKGASTFTYRGPDAFKVFTNGDVTLGLNRLSIVDVSERSHQPLVHESGNYVISYNGEIFNYSSLKAELAKKHVFRTSSDTEVILLGYIEYGVDIFSKIEGMYGVAIYDKVKKKIILGRDHRGIKPLYYFYDNKEIIFASEMKGVTTILKEKNIKFNLNPIAIDLFWPLGYIPSPHTMYENIFKLPKQTYLVFDIETKSISNPIKYYLPDFPVQSYTEFQETLEKKVLDHLAADVPVGVFFSGGTDSTLIAAILHKYKINLETFSIKLNFKTEDYKYFRKIAEFLNLKNSEFEFDVKEFDEVYEEVMSKMDEPTYDNSIFPTYFVSKKASEKVKVVLSGEGGDEFFYGYPRSVGLYNMKNVNLDNEVNFLDWLFIHLPNFKAKNHYFLKIFSLLKKPISYYILSMSPSRDYMTWTSFKAIKKYISELNVGPMAFDQELYLENDLLRKTDFATSYTSIEGRVPLLDYELLYKSRFFEERHLENYTLKAFLKNILANYIPRELVYRNKSGFGIGLTPFFKQSKYMLKDLESAIDYLNQLSIINLNKKEIENIVTRYPNYGFSIISLFRSIKNTL